MNCQNAQDHLPRFFEDLLTDDEYQEVDWHLRRCPSCREYASSTGSLSYLTREMGNIKAPEDLTETVKFRLGEAMDHGANAGPGPARQKRGPGKVPVIPAVLALAAGLVLILFFRKEPPAKTGVQTVMPMPETGAGIGEKIQRQASVKEAEILYAKLEMMADTLTKTASGYQKKETPEAESVRAPAEPIPSTAPAALHWHIPYSGDAQREQFDDTLSVMGIDPDFSDDHFCVFSAGPDQVKKILEGMRFAGKVQVPDSEFIRLSQVPPGVVPVSVYFIKRELQTLDVPEPPVRKKDGVFLSVEQAAEAAERVFDWHILADPAQREKIVNVIRRGRGDIHYLSDAAVIFSVAGSGLAGLMEELGRLGGVFPDFGRPESYDGAASLGTVSILIYLKEQ